MLLCFLLEEVYAPPTQPESYLDCIFLVGQFRRGRQKILCHPDLCKASPGAPVPALIEDVVPIPPVLSSRSKDFALPLVRRSRSRYDKCMSRHTLHNEFTAIIERDGKWYIGYCPEIPGANGQGETVEECKKNLADAIVLILQNRREDAQRGLPADAVQDVAASREEDSPFAAPPLSWLRTQA